jgi:hypothetical protein
VLAQFDIDVFRFGVTQSSGKIRIDAARADLAEQLKAHSDSKFNLLEAAITEWNRERLNEDTEPVINGVVEYTINNVSKLATEISYAKTRFLSHSSGDDNDKTKVYFCILTIYWRGG